MNTPFIKKGVARAVSGALLAGGAALLISGMFTQSASAATSIADTKHNLSVNGTGPAHLDPAGSVTTTQICVFCHTPHGANTSVQAPLWNKITTAPTTYTTYDKLGTSTLHGTVLPVGSVSLACLSCHDGTAALNVMINAPGSGGYNASGATFGTMTGAAVDASTGKLAAGIIANIGVDLRNDHPVGIEYGGGLVTPGSASSDIKLPNDFHGTAYSGTLGGALQNGTVNGQPVWWVDTNGGTTGTRDKTDIMLYTRTNGSDEPFVECASCHDPHSTNVTFLRVANTGSALCLSCHIK